MSLYRITYILYIYIVYYNIIHYTYILYIYIYIYIYIYKRTKKDTRQLIYTPVTPLRLFSDQDNSFTLMQSVQCTVSTQSSE
jgi:hypothetical protein